MVTLYGITSCDTVKKARRWLEERGITYRFHDLRKDGLDATLLGAWERALGWEALLNRRGATWRKLSEAQRCGLDRDRAVALMLAHPTLVKRPVLDLGGSIRVGFRQDEYEQVFR